MQSIQDRCGLVSGRLSGVLPYLEGVPPVFLRGAEYGCVRPDEVGCSIGPLCL